MMALPMPDEVDPVPTPTCFAPARPAICLDCGGKPLDLSQPVVMGILNVTPDSFSDGGRYTDVGAAVAHGRRMVAEGAAIIDVGGESTRPGAAPVDARAEIERVVPVIEALAGSVPVPIAIDTSKPEVIAAAAAAGAGLVNDVYGLRREGALEAAAASGLPVCIMHMQGEPRTMQQSPAYDDVVAEVIAFLAERIESCVAAGVARSRILVDPGIGFGKTLAHNLALLAAVERLVRELDCPVLIGVSRKSMFASLLGRAVDERLPASLAAALAAVAGGASVIRAHDVRETVDALAVWAALAACRT